MKYLVIIVLIVLLASSVVFADEVLYKMTCTEETCFVYNIKTGNIHCYITTIAYGNVIDKKLETKYKECKGDNK